MIFGLLGHQVCLGIKQLRGKIQIIFSINSERISYKKKGGSNRRKKKQSIHTYKNTSPKEKNKIKKCDSFISTFSSHLHWNLHPFYLPYTHHLQPSINHHPSLHSIIGSPRFFSFLKKKQNKTSHGPTSTLLFLASSTTNNTKPKTTPLMVY